MRKRLRCREKSFFKDILTCFCCLSVSFFEWGSFFQKQMTPFLLQIASHFRGALGTAIAVDLSAPLWFVSVHKSGSKIPQLTPERELTCYTELAYARPVVAAI